MTYYGAMIDNTPMWCYWPNE